jgi:hypothetical protein
LPKEYHKCWNYYKNETIETNYARKNIEILRCFRDTVMKLDFDQCLVESTTVDGDKKAPVITDLEQMQYAKWCMRSKKEEFQV